MIGYVTLGTNDLEKAAGFYDELLKLIDAGRFMEEESFVAWATSPTTPGLSVTRPYDGNAATVGNGVMVALLEFTGKWALDRQVIQSKHAEDPRFMGTVQFVQFLKDYMRHPSWTQQSPIARLTFPGPLA